MKVLELYLTVFNILLSSDPNLVVLMFVLMLIAWLSDFFNRQNCTC